MIPTIAPLSSAPTTASRLKAWLQLLRLPNLFTVPGDALAGYCLGALVSGSDSFPPSVSPSAIAVAGLMFYCAGLLHNDCFDRETDLRERPSRPIPSGSVNPRHVLLAGHLLNLGGLIIAFAIGLVPGMVASALVVAATVYNAFSKKIPVLGPANIGLCRGLLFLLGASLFPAQAVFSAPVWWCVISYTLFVASISRIAAGETERYRSGGLRWAPGIILLLWLVGVRMLVLPTWPQESAFAVLSLTAVVWSFRAGARLKPGLPPALTQRCIGIFLRTVLLIQPAVVALAGGPLVLVLLFLAFLPLSGALGRRFYAS